MLRVVFWNVDGRRRDRHLVGLAVDNAADVIILIEPPASAGRLGALTALGYNRVPGSTRFLILSLQSVTWTRVSYPDPLAGVEFWRLSPTSGDSWLFAVVHAPDRRNAPQDETRALFFSQISTHLGQLERGNSPRRTVVLGDFNANPFEPSVMGASGFHALGVRRVRQRTARAVLRLGRRDFFYNPMWRLYGSDPSTDAAAATYYHDKGNAATEPFWHMLDQVLVRPEVADRMPADRLRVLTTAGSESLVRPDGVPDRETASDHLPVTFQLL
ncbi:MAG TPA: endonuclease/exonuclease/phosphatase family protein [Urbifossiella sp.]|jgi:hypothetical protein|nr:endonuclease/exonuclease/phosphatase family protein [Urbifossiella sp.]